MTTHCLRSLFPRWVGLVGLLAILVPGLARGDEWFVKVEGVPGELTDGPFAGWTPLSSVGALVNVQVDTNLTTARSFGCEITKAFGRLSPALLKSCGTGERIGRMTFAYVLSRPRATQYRIVLHDTLVSSVRQEAARDSSKGLEKFAFSFNKIEFECLDLDENGGLNGGLTAIVNPATGISELKERSVFRATLSRQDGRKGVLMSWPAEAGRRYRILSRATWELPWKTLLEHTAREDGTASEFITMDPPSLFMRVEELE